MDIDIVKRIRVLFIMLLCICLPIVALAAGETVRVGWYQVDGLQNYDEQTDEYSGYDYEYLKAIAQITGWKYEFLRMPFNDCMTALRNGDIDIVGGLAKLPEREQQYLYPINNSGYAGPRLVTLDSNKQYAYEGISDFNGMRIGVHGLGNVSKVLNQYVQDHQLSVETVVFNTQAEMLQALREGSIDAIIVSGTMRLPGMRLLVQMPQQEIYFVTSLGKTWIRDGLDKAIGQIKFYDSNFSNNLKSHYFSTSGIPVVAFTTEEKNYIAKRLEEGRPIEVAFDPAWAPIEYKDPETGEMTGVMKGVFQLLTKETGLQFKYVTAHTYVKTIEKYQDTAELFSSLGYDYDWGEKHNLFLTQPVFEVQVYSLFQKNGDKNYVVALPQGYYLAKAAMTWIRENEPEKAGQVTFVYYDTMEECIDAVCNGDVGRTFVNAYEINYYMDKLRMAQINIQSESGFTEKISIGVSRKADPLLFSIISRTLRSIPKGEIDSMVSTYSQGRHTPGFKDYIYAHPLKSMAASGVILLLIAVVIFFYYSNKKNQRQRRELEIANNAKSEFLSRISHDIRTPMNAIMGMTALAQRENHSEQVGDYLEKIDFSSKFLLELINDILDMSRIEKGHISLQPQPYYLTDFEALVISTTKVLAEQKNIHFTFEADYDIPCIRVDVLRFNQIFLNLLSNAMKFTPENGYVSFVLKKISGQDNQIQLQGCIKDTGIGISKEFLPHLFEPFAQENKKHVNIKEGSGLGLAIVKRLVDVLQGHIEVVSEKGKGSTFTVTLPMEIVDLPKDADKAEKTVDVSELKGKKILIVEDNELNQEVVQQILTFYGIQCITAGNGQIAVDKFTATEVGELDAILMDIRMPVMDGMEAAKKIRAMSRPDAAKIPIIALTADAYADEQARIMASGMTAYLAKPVSPEQLIKTIYQVLYK